MVVRDDEDALADPGPRCGSRECFGAGQRMPPLPFDGEIGELLAQKRSAGDMRLQVQLSPSLDAVELVRAVDEAILDQ